MSFWAFSESKLTSESFHHNSVNKGSTFSIILYFSNTATPIPLSIVNYLIVFGLFSVIIAHITVLALFLYM